jgi:proteasome lid subunit RPN8/RPN11
MEKNSEGIDTHINTKGNDPIYLSNPDYNSPEKSFIIDNTVTQKTSILRQKSIETNLEYLFFIARDSDGTGVEVRPEKPISGNKQEVWGIRPTTRGRYSRRAIEYLGSIHSHPNSSPPSSIDLGMIICGKDSIAIITTKDKTYAFIATKQTKRVDGIIWEWSKEKETEFTKSIQNASHRKNESDEEFVDRKILEQTLDLCKKHNILIYISDDNKGYMLKQENT